MNNITIQNCDFLKMLPLWMRLDPTDKSLAESMDYVTDVLTKKIAIISKWKDIDNFTEERLDELAWEMNVSWYRYDATLKQKRNIIKNAKRVHRKLGTKWAMEQVLTCYFDDSTILEWWEYGGEPGHFKIQAVNTDTVDKDAEPFLAILDDVKRYSQVLDEIEILSSSSMEVEYIIRPRTVDKITSIMKE